MRSKHNRGYVMMEAAVGGALVAVILASLMGQLAGARTQNVVAGRDMIAANLVTEKIELQRSLGFANVATGCAAGTTTETTVAGQTGSYTRTCATAAANLTFNSVTVTCTEITVNVTYDAGSGVRTKKGVSRVCQ